jgi:hypothetical protein
MDRRLVPTVYKFSSGVVAGCEIRFEAVCEIAQVQVSSVEEELNMLDVLDVRPTVRRCSE